jgi:hypothetical protein
VIAGARGVGHDDGVADLEKLAIQRDRGYLVRLVLFLVVGLVVSIAMFGWLTGSSVSGCAAQSFGSVTETK